jgi:predicted ester cyclase
MFRFRNLFIVALALAGLLLLSGLLFPRISAAQDDMGQAHKDALMRIVDEAFNQGNVDVLDEVLAEDYISHNPDGTTGNRDEFKQDILAWRAALPDLVATADPVIAEGDWIALRFTMTGTFTNELVNPGQDPIAPTGQPFTFTSNILSRFNAEGQIVEEWDEFDTLTILIQLGALDDMIAAMSAGGGDTGMLDGNALVDERCTVCHSRERIDNADKDEAGWTETVDRMIGHGAQLSDEERAAVIQYLVETH